jgi:hypothetical protein
MAQVPSDRTHSTLLEPPGHPEGTHLGGQQQSGDRAEQLDHPAVGRCLLGSGPGWRCHLSLFIQAQCVRAPEPQLDGSCPAPHGAQ